MKYRQDGRYPVAGREAHPASESLTPSARSADLGSSMHRIDELGQVVAADLRVEYHVIHAELLADRVHFR